jgi:biopolymer transport protein ExbD
MKVKIAILFVALVCFSGASTFAADKKMVVLPKVPVETPSKDKEPVALLNMAQSGKEAKVEKPSRVMDKVRCNLNSRYRSCF